MAGIKKYLIVLAWAEKTELVPTGRIIRRDMNYVPEFDLAYEGRAAVWLNSGSAEDVKRAKAHAEKEGLHVFCFPTAERDALRLARDKAVAMAMEAEGKL